MEGTYSPRAQIPSTQVLRVQAGSTAPQNSQATTYGRAGRHPELSMRKHLKYTKKIRPEKNLLERQKAESCHPVWIGWMSGCSNSFPAFKNNSGPVHPTWVTSLKRRLRLQRDGGHVLRLLSTCLLGIELCSG